MFIFKGFQYGFDRCLSILQYNCVILHYYECNTNVHAISCSNMA